MEAALAGHDPLGFPEVSKQVEEARSHAVAREGLEGSVPVYGIVCFPEIDVDLEQGEVSDTGELLLELCLDVPRWILKPWRISWRTTTALTLVSMMALQCFQATFRRPMPRAVPSDLGRSARRDHASSWGRRWCSNTCWSSATYGSHRVRFGAASSVAYLCHSRTYSASMPEGPGDLASFRWMTAAAISSSVGIESSIS
jgi:hypothetical protein